MTAFQGKAANHRRLRATLFALGMACMLSVPVRAEQAGSFWIRSAHTVLINAVYHLDARIDFHLSSAALEALHNGVPLTIDIHMQVVRNRDWLWSQVVADLHQRYRLQYHALSERYLVKNLNTGVVSSHQALQDALESMGIIHNFPMLDEHLLTPGYRYVGRLQASLDIEALPTPMRVWAYVTPQWHLSTDWYTWPLKG
ncbi:MAG TPA: DUF4390 domain-containing protein [Gammaproteobacteria bacterium]|nr:DUF4390 domain-containing protein [Gammaproteobacteria bacterium]